MPIQADSDSSHSVNSFFAKQNRSLLRDFSESGMCLVAVAPDKLNDLKRLRGWTVEPLPGCLASNACIVRKESNFDAECWVRWDYRGYRRAFASYLRVCHPEFNSILNTDVQVDHLEPRFRFSKGDRFFVRLHLIRRNINAAFGAGYERSFYQVEREKSLHGAVHMSWLGFCKAYGILPPGKNVGTAAWEAWAKKHACEFSREAGELEMDAYPGLLAVLQLGYTGYYSGYAQPL